MPVTVDRIVAPLHSADKSALAQMLVDVIEDGASIGWTQTPTLEEVESWWDHHVADAGVIVWVARDDDGSVLGTVSLGTTWKPNSRHRAEVMKLMVPPQHRGHGISSVLMQELEAYARAQEISLLILDTEQGSLAESLYHRWGWLDYGVIPDYVTGPSNQFLPCVFMLKRI